MTRRSPPTLVALTVLASLAAPLGADQKADIPVSRVVLYSSGVAYFEHAGQVEGDATLALRFKTDQINDVLKSMVFADADGGYINEEPPMGGIAQQVPEGSTVVQEGGKMYFQFDTVFFEQMTSGSGTTYKVVPPPGVSDVAT